MSGPRFDDDLDYWVDNPDEREDIERRTELAVRLILDEGMSVPAAILAAIEDDA